jgi:hypothetical protein
MLIKAVLLDLAVAIKAMRHDFGLAELPLDAVARYVGKGAENLVHRSLTDADDGIVNMLAHAADLLAAQR